MAATGDERHDVSVSTTALARTIADAVSRILKANDLTLYNPNARKTFEKEFREYEFNLKNPLTHAEGKRQGLLIFQSANKDPVASPKNLTLTVDGLAQPVTLKLN